MTFRREMPMLEVGTTKAVQLLDLLLDFFADDGRWMQGHYSDGRGRRCLIGAILHLSAEHRLPGRPAMSLLEEALPQRQLGLIRFNDEHCRNAMELRLLISRARALAIENAELERAA